MLMRKNFPILLLLTAVVLLATAGPLLAAEAPLWQLTLRDDGTITEKVTVPAAADLKPDGWKVVTADGQLVAQRTVKDWASYTQLTDRLPLQIDKQNRLIWQDVEIDKQGSQASAAGLAATVLANDQSRIMFTVPGFIDQNVGNQLDADQVEVTALELNKLADGQSVLQMTILNGLMLGISLFVLGFLVVVIVFMNRIRRVNRMIEEEYSLEKAAQQLEEEESGQKPADDKEDE